MCVFVFTIDFRMLLYLRMLIKIKYLFYEGMQVIHALIFIISFSSIQHGVMELAEAVKIRIGTTVSILIAQL